MYIWLLFLVPTVCLFVMCTSTKRFSRDKSRVKSAVFLFASQMVLWVPKSCICGHLWMGRCVYVLRVLCVLRVQMCVYVYMYMSIFVHVVCVRGCACLHLFTLVSVSPFVFPSCFLIIFIFYRMVLINAPRDRLMQHRDILFHSLKNFSRKRTFFVVVDPYYWFELTQRKKNCLYIVLVYFCITVTVTM